MKSKTQYFSHHQNSACHDAKCLGILHFSQMIEARMDVHIISNGCDVTSSDTKVRNLTKEEKKRIITQVRV
jgi:hypothetical protein